MPPDGSTMEGYLAMLRSLLCRDGAGRMRADAPHDRRLGQLRARPLGTLRHRAGSHRDARPGGRVSREAAGDGQPLVARSRPVPGPAAGGPDGGGGPRRPHQAAGGPARDRYVYYPDAAEVPESAAVNIRNRSYTITVEVDIQSEDAAGVLFSHGARFGGHSLYVKDRKLKYVYNFVGSRDQTIQGVRDAVHLRNRWNHRPRANQRRCASCMDDGSTIRGRPGLITLGQDAVPARYSGCRWSASGRPRRRSAPLPRPAARETMRCPRVWKRRCPR
jgi:hypothetical protein